MPTPFDWDDSDPPLSSQQLAAVLSDASAIAVLASAGSGKTEVVARRAQRLLRLADGDGGKKILALSYTKKAAEELRSRLDERLGALAANVEADTVHGFAHSLVRQHGTRIGLPLEPELLVRDEDRAELFTRWLNAQGATPPGDLESELRKLDLLRARNRRSPMLDEWEAALESASALDYSALLSVARSILESKAARRQLRRTYAHLIVDEAQNLTPSQYDLITEIIGTPADLSVVSAMLVGDDKQSIISFAGADPSLIQRFIDDYGATLYELTTNFRSAYSISALSNRIAVAFGQQVVGDAAEAHGAAGLIAFEEADDETREGEVVAAWVETLLSKGMPSEALAPSESAAIAASDVAILGRSAAALRYVAKALDAKGIQAESASGSSDWLDTALAKVALEIVGLRADSAHQSVHWQLSRLLGVDSATVTSVQDLQEVLAASADRNFAALSELCEIDNVRDFLAAVTSLDAPGNAETSELAAWQTDVDQLRDTWTDFERSTDQSGQTWGNFKLFCSRRQRGDDASPGVRLLTIHKAQGREFRAVAIVGLNNGQIPDFRARSEDERLAELRTFYVAVTRAQRLLLLTRAKSRLTGYGTRRTDASPYLRFLKS
ncbi:ATP-dependent helicase [Mycolicibacterium fortuitum]|uniref:ATP-dependent helicase n=1 Tax=Mycolicibacterium fortuitum TaxID=1766 RepID=UPI0009436EF4|nr:ATP-dependent helicase [Mycolicibacterium fortuitum]